MFFRREKPKQLTFQDYLTKAEKQHFVTEKTIAGHAKVSRGGVAAILEDVPGQHPKVSERAGLEMGPEIASLVDGGFQKFFQTPSGKKRPAQASELKAVHEFQEDLREALGIPSLYNESLGTVSNLYLYDRVDDRDAGITHPWTVKTEL